MKKNNELAKKGMKSTRPLYPIRIVSELIGTSEQTLRLYEKHGLIVPSRRNTHRYYSDNDIQWLLCLRELIHDKKISIEGIKKLLSYAQCCDINKCSSDRRQRCTVYRSKVEDGELSKIACNRETCKVCNNGEDITSRQSFN